MCDPVLERFVNITLRSTSEAAGDATQVQSTNEKDQTDRIRHHEDVGGRFVGWIVATVLPGNTLECADK